MKSCVLVKISKQTLSFWYQIEGGDYAPLSLKEGNEVPLCFYVNGNDFKVGSFAKERCLVNDPNSYNNYFESVKDPSKYFILHGDSKPYKQLLYYGIENYLSHFVKTILYKNESIEAFRINFCLRFWFDDDIENPERNLVNNLFKEAGYENVDTINIDNHLKSQISGDSKSGKARIYLSAIANDLFVKLYSSQHSFLSQFILEELGSDPRAKILAKLILEDIKEASPFIDVNEEVEIGHIINHCTNLLSSLTPLMRNEIELSTGVQAEYKIRLNHLNERLTYNRGIEDKVIPQLESIISENSLSNSSVDIFLVGDDLNTNYFKEKLTKKFPSVFGVASIIQTKLMKSIFTEVSSSGYVLNSRVSSIKIGITPSPIQTLPKETPPPVVKTPPILNTPPVVKIPPIPVKQVSVLENKQTPKPEIKAPPIIKPEVKLPPVIKDVKKVEIPPLPPRAKVPPPPPPPPPIKKK